MTRFDSDPEFSHSSLPTTGILLANLGTPEAPTPRAVRRYLAEFLWDPRVIELPRALWWLILHAVILRVRPARSAAAYRKVWTAEGSPLLVNTRAQAQGLSRALASLGHESLELTVGMRYGKPSIRSALEKLRKRGARRILVLPLYPQYSGTTTASTLDAVANVFRRWRWVPELHFITHYHDLAGYIAALADSVRESWSQKGRGERLLFSFHGIPRRYFLAGDPYHCQCHKTARLVARELDLADHEWAIAFQSRVGREEWLRPYTDEILGEWARSGVRSVDVQCPGFSADCLETLEEIDEQYRELFLGAGGEAFHYIPALNDRPAHLRALADLLDQHLRTGATTAPDPMTVRETTERALAMGASS